MVGLFRLGLIGACSIALQVSNLGAQSTGGSQTSSAPTQTNFVARSNAQPTEAAGPTVSSSSGVTPLKSSASHRYARIHDLEPPRAELLEVRTTIRPARVD